MMQLSGQWHAALKDEIAKPYYEALSDFVDAEYASATVYPKREQILRAFELTPLNDVKVVILGQDPYHGEGQAHGLAFSVEPGIKLPPSLKNIYKEIEADIGESTTNGDLTDWAKQGVLLLNTVLTVRAGEAHSHKNKGWENFTDAVIRRLNDEDRPMVFVLWGKPAQTKCALLNNPKHLCLTAPHPSPLSAYRGFFGCGHFSKINAYLKDNDLAEIQW